MLKRQMFGRAGFALLRKRVLLALGPPPPNPFMSGRPRNPHLGSDMGDRTAGRDTFDQQTPPEDRQPGITVGHEDLRVVRS